MTATARHARHGAVTVAARQAITMAGPCEPGDVLGVDRGRLRRGRRRPASRSPTEVLERLLGGGGELVTLVSGAGRRRPGRSAARSTSPTSTPMSTSWCTTGARSATRC